MNTTTKTENRTKKALQRLSDKVRQIDGLTFGYVGNVGAGYDDRCYHIWIDGLTVETGFYAGNMESLWFASNPNLQQLNVAHALVRAFEQGRRSFNVRNAS